MCSHIFFYPVSLKPQRRRFFLSALHSDQTRWPSATELTALAAPLFRAVSQTLVVGELSSPHTAWMIRDQQLQHFLFFTPNQMLKHAMLVQSSSHYSIAHQTLGTSETQQLPPPRGTQSYTQFVCFTHVRGSPHALRLDLLLFPFPAPDDCPWGKALDQLIGKF